MPEKDRFPAVLQPVEVTPFDTTQITSPYNYSHPKPGDPCHPLAATAHPPAVCIAFALRGREEGAVPEMHGDGDTVGALRASPGGSSRDYVAVIGFSSKDYGQDAASEIAPTVRAMNHSASHINGGGQVAVCTAEAIPITENALRGDTEAKTPSADADGVIRLRDPGLGIGNPGDPANTLLANGFGAVFYRYVVRRLMPVEGERLQGFPDGHTDVPYGNRRAPNTQRYKQIGNSMAVNKMRWLGERIIAELQLSGDPRQNATPFREKVADRY